MAVDEAPQAVPEKSSIELSEKTKNESISVDTNDEDQRRIERKLVRKLDMVNLRTSR